MGLFIGLVGVVYVVLEFIFLIEFFVNMCEVDVGWGVE